jgi:hypothetical protein
VNGRFSNLLLSIMMIVVLALGLLPATHAQEGSKPAYCGKVLCHPSRHPYATLFKGSSVYRAGSPMTPDSASGPHFLPRIDV